MKPLRLGVIGVGTIGLSHLEVFASLPDVDIVAVADLDVERARAVATQFDVPNWYSQAKDLLSDAAVDAVTVATPENDHREATLGALQAGKHVLVEKPMATTIEDAAEMVRAASKAPGILMPGHVLRFEPRYAALRTVARDGSLGRVMSLSARRNRRSGLIARYSRVHPALVTAIHDVDMMLWITEDRVASMHAVDRISTQDRGAHGIWGIVEFEHGAVGTLTAVWHLPDDYGIETDDAFEVIGSEGLARVQLDAPTLQLWRNGRASQPDAFYTPNLHQSSVGALRNELAHFVACAQNGVRPSIVTPEDGYQAVAAVLGLIEAARGEVQGTATSSTQPSDLIADERR